MNILSVFFNKANLFIKMNLLSYLGEHVFFNLYINNESTKELNNIEVQLVQQTDLQSKESFRLVGAIKFPKNVSKKSSESLISAAIKILPVAPSFTISLIRVSYFLTLNLNPSDKSDRLNLKSNDVRVPIVIGKCLYFVYIRGTSIC